MSNRRGKLVVLSGPSGSGKTTVADRLRDLQGDIVESVSYTTRQPRDGETDGEHYYFVSEKEFQENIKAKAFLEWANVFGSYYGTLRETTEKLVEAGKKVILTIDVQGAAQVRDKGVADHFIFLLPPSLDELKRRLEARKSESDEMIVKRLSEAKKEMAESDKFDFNIVNKNVDETVSEILKIINS